MRANVADDNWNVDCDIDCIQFAIDDSLFHGDNDGDKYSDVICEQHSDNIDLDDCYHV